MNTHDVICLIKTRFDLKSDLVLEDIGHDWVVSERRSELMGGGLRYILSKNAAEPFAIPSYCGASKESGVGTDYEIIITSIGTNTIGLARALSKVTDLPAARILTQLKKELPFHMGTFFLSSPLELGREVVLNGATCTLSRPDNCGGYSCD